MEDHDIHIAYDRKNGKYVAYNAEQGIFAIGVCVTTACNKYREKYYEKAALFLTQEVKLVDA